jgi:hypothetical protein
MADTLAKPQADTVLEVLDKEGSWFWVLITRDSHGTQRVGWVKDSDVEFVDSTVARFFPPPAPVPGREEPATQGLAADAAHAEAPSTETPLAETALPETATANAAAERLKAEEKPASGAKTLEMAKAEKPKNVDDRKLRKAAQEYERALQAYEKLQFSMLATVQPLQPVGEPIVEPLYSLPN